jgi:hypothetical protein
LLNIAQDRRPCYRPGHLADPHPVRRESLSRFVPSGVSPWRTTVGLGCGRVFTRPTSVRRPSSSPGARIFRSGPWSRTFRCEAFGQRPCGRDLGAGTARGGRAWFLVPPEGGSTGQVRPDRDEPLARSIASGASPSASIVSDPSWIWCSDLSIRVLVPYLSVRGLRSSTLVVVTLNQNGSRCSGRVSSPTRRRS